MSFSAGERTSLNAAAGTFVFGWDTVATKGLDIQLERRTQDEPDLTEVGEEEILVSHNGRRADCR